MVPLLERKSYFYLEILLWVAALEAEPGKRQNTLSSEVKARCLPWLLNLCPPIPTDRYWYGYYHVCFPHKMTEVNCVLFSCDFYSGVSQGWWSALGMTQLDQRHRPEPGVGQAGLSRREGLTQTKQQPWLFRVALDWKHLVSSGNSVCKRIYKLKIWSGKSLLMSASSSVAMQSVSVLGQRAQSAGLPCPRHPQVANKHFFPFCVGNNTQLCSKSSLWTKRKHDTYINKDKNL